MTCIWYKICNCWIFLLTHPVWDVTLFFLIAHSVLRISTHTSRVGCDHILCSLHPPAYLISTHTSRVGCDFAELFTALIASLKFLLTHPVWDVTFHLLSIHNIYVISTHTSRVGCDAIQFVVLLHLHQFLLTHPVWDVTYVHRCILIDI